MSVPVSLLLTDQLLGSSAAMKELRERVVDAAHDEAPVLIEGEHGTGRERVARLLHENGPRKAASFVRLDPDETEPERVEAEVARAHGGTLLVREVAHLGRRRQRRLISALRRFAAKQGGGRADVRLIGSTGVDLQRATEEELFEPELFESFRGRRLRLVPLRRRVGDIPLLVEHFARDEASEIGVVPPVLTPRAMDKILNYSWPGNVAELRDVVRRLCLKRRRGPVDLGDVEALLPPIQERVPLEDLSLEELVRSKVRALLERMEGYPLEDLYEVVLARVEKPLFELVLERTGFNQSRAAELLGINRNTLRTKVAQRRVRTSAEDFDAPPTPPHGSTTKKRR